VVSESTSLYKHLFFTTSDSGGLVEAAIPDAVLSATDRNKPTFENAQSPGGQVSDFDLGQGSEATHLTARLAAADVSGPVSESAGSANKGGALDLGTGTESAALHVAVSASDSGVASERTYLHQGKSSFDLGEGHESASLAARLPSYSDDGTGSDGEFIRVFVSGGIEVGRATEVFALVSKIFVTDSGVVFDKADSFVYATVSDSGTGLEYESGIGLRVFDSGSGSDAETLVALFIQKDLGSGAEGQHRDPPLVLFTDQPGGSILDPAMGHISNSPAVGTVERPFVPKGTFRWPTQGRIVK
jgi:outer membrane protein assembly factor BamB